MSIVIPSSPPSYDTSLFEDYSKAYNPYSAPVSSTSRVGCTLYISNLPPQTRPQHLGKIFAEPYPKGGKRGRERDAGITMIEIYTIPRVESSQSALSDTETESTTTAKSSDSNKWSLSSSLKRAIIKNPSPSVHITTSTQLRSVRSNSSGSSSSSSNSRPTPNPASRQGLAPTPTPAAVGTGEITVHVQGVEDDVETQEEQEETRASLDTMDDEDKITIAYVHFESDNHLQRAKHTLSEITIGGREITYETIGQPKSKSHQQQISNSNSNSKSNNRDNIKGDDISKVNVNVKVGKRMWAWWTRENQVPQELAA